MSSVLPGNATPSIAVLDPTVAARIAAGEVIDRPAAVVKELLENALDARATALRVLVDDGGVARLAVQDNGHGIAADALDLAFTRHATSKLRYLADLEALTTLGFRGEALPSIAAVAEVAIKTRRPDDQTGVSALLRNGRVVAREAVGLPAGTTIEVRDLFSTLPARRKFLKGRQAETSAINQVVSQYALAYPSVAVTLVVDGVVQLSTAGASTVRDVLACLWGVSVVDQLLDVYEERHGICVHGLASRVGHTKATRTQQSFFVNGRWVRNRVLHVALEEAYQSMLFGGRHPLGVLFIDLPPEDLDVNVHPAKTEVRFVREREVFGAVRHAVHSALSEVMAFAHVQPDSEPGGEDAPSGAQAELPIPPIHDAAPQPDGTLQAPARALPVLRVLGQANALFIIAEGPEGVYMVDQHAAHERVLYDELCAQLEGRGVPMQALLEPLLLEISAAQMESLAQSGTLLHELGFEVEPFGVSTALVRAVPTMLSGGHISEAVLALLEDLTEGKEHSERRERSLATMACKAAVKAGQTLSMEEMRSLVQQLETTGRPRTCPHGRPTMILLSTSTLERQFGRR